MRIEVTQDMLDRGVPWDGGKCPVALAFRAQCPGVRFLHVASRFTRWVDADWKTKQVDNPRELADFIDKFNKGRPVRPRSFDLPEKP